MARSRRHEEKGKERKEEEQTQGNQREYKEMRRGMKAVA